MRRWTGFALALLFAAPACAQVSGSVTLLSDYRYRGASLSDAAPTGQLALAWDRGDGWYAGVQLTRVRFAYADAGAELQAVPYLGYVRVLRPGLNAEAGVQYTWFSTTQSYNYPELYLGLSGERLSARVSRMPHYFGQAVAWYGEVDGSHPLRGKLRAVGHLGALRADKTDGYFDNSPARWRYDFAAGLGLALPRFDLQLTWTTASGNALPNSSCAPYGCGGRNAWVLRLTRNW